MQRSLWTRREALAVLAATPWITRADAQPTTRFPDRALHMLIPAAPGGAQDVQTRRILPRLGESLQQQVIPENVPGAAGGIALEHLLRAAPDGYTMAMAPVAIAVQPHLMKTPYDTLQDLAAVSKVSAGPFVLAAPASAPYDSVTAMVEHARRAGDPPPIAGFGQGGLGHLTVLLLARETGVPFSHVPYTGGSQQVTDLIGGQIQLLLDFASTLRPHVVTGRIKALGVAAQRRLAVLPDVPTFAEQGLAGLVVVAWQGIVVRSGTPDAAIRTLHAALVRALGDPDVRSAFEASGVEVGGDTPEEFGAFIHAEHARWGQLIREAGVKLG